MRYEGLCQNVTNEHTHAHTPMEGILYSPDLCLLTVILLQTSSKIIMQVKEQTQ